MSDKKKNGQKEEKPSQGIPKNRSYAKSRQEDVVELSVIVPYVIQQRGRASNRALCEIFKTELGSRVSKPLMHHVLMMLKDKDILAAINEGGDWVYKMKKLAFNCNVELAHVTRMIPTLVDDPAGMAIKAQIEHALATTKNGTKTTQKYPAAWAQYEVQFELATPWYGALPYEGNAYAALCYKRSPFQSFNPADCDLEKIPLVFERDPNTGELLVHRSCIKGFIANHLRFLGMGAGRVDLFGLEEIRISPKSKLVVSSMGIGIHAIQRAVAGSDKKSEKGAGFGYYESVLPGEVITWRFLAPTENFVSPERMKRWLELSLRSPVRSMSPARGVQTGSARLIDLKYELLHLDEEETSSEEQSEVTPD